MNNAINGPISEGGSYVQDATGAMVRASGTAPIQRIQATEADALAQSSESAADANGEA